MNPGSSTSMMSTASMLIWFLLGCEQGAAEGIDGVMEKHSMTKSSGQSVMAWRILRNHDFRVVSSLACGRRCCQCLVKLGGLEEWRPVLGGGGCIGASAAASASSPGRPVAAEGSTTGGTGGRVAEGAWWRGFSKSG